MIKDKQLYYTFYYFQTTVFVCMPVRGCLFVSIVFLIKISPNISKYLDQWIKGAWWYSTMKCKFNLLIIIFRIIYYFSSICVFSLYVVSLLPKFELN